MSRCGGTDCQVLTFAFQIQLRNFANATRQLGSSVGILSSAFHLRERLAQILFLFRENAADLFPRKITREPREALVNPAIRKFRKRSRDGASTQIVNTSAFEEIDCEHFPEQLRLFGEDVITFLDCLNEFPEFTDEAVNSSILSLEGDLKVRGLLFLVYLHNDKPSSVVVLVILPSYIRR